MKKHLIVWLSLTCITAMSENDPAQAPSGRTSPQLRSQTNGNIQVFDNAVFDSVGKPPKLETYEYTSDQYGTWVSNCESKKGESMEAFRSCFQQQKTRTLGAQKMQREEVSRRKPYRNVPAPSALDPGPRNPSFDATTDRLVEPESDSEND